MKLHAGALQKTAKILNDKQKEFLWSHPHRLGGSSMGKAGPGAGYKHGGGKRGTKRGPAK
jgi:hypothetical protein